MNSSSCSSFHTGQSQIPSICVQCEQLPDIDDVIIKISCGCNEAKVCTTCLFKNITELGKCKRCNLDWNWWIWFEIFINVISLLYFY